MDKKKNNNLPTPANEGIQAYLDRVKAKYERTMVEQAKETAAEVHREIGSAPEQQWLPFAPMPTDMCRVSPFFPIARSQLGELPFIRDMVITKSSWGQITYTGPKLSIYEEDVLLAVLALLKSADNRQETEVEGKTTYTYQGPLAPILRLIGLSKSGQNYKRTVKALELMTVAGVRLEQKNGRRIMKSMLAVADWNDKKKELTVTVNPYFFEMYMSGSVTMLDVLIRSQINSPIAKSLYRFIQSHRDKSWQGHFLTLAAALNLNMEQPPKQIKRQVKNAIALLVKMDLLEPASGIKGDIVKLVSPRNPKKELTTG